MTLRNLIKTYNLRQMLKWQLEAISISIYGLKTGKTKVLTVISSKSLERNFRALSEWTNKWNILIK